MIKSFVFNLLGELKSRDADAAALTAALADPQLFAWVELDCPTPDEAKQVLQDQFHVHPLSIEDCLSGSPSPKVEVYAPGAEDAFAPYLFVILHAVDYNQHERVFATSELNLFIGKNCLITHHAVHLRSVASIWDRCAKGDSNIPRGPDKVAYALIDALVDRYNPALDELSQEISNLETEALERPTPAIMTKVMGLKKEVLHLRQIIGPQRDVVTRLSAGEFKLIQPYLIPYFRDVYDALFHIGEVAQAYTDSLTGILQVYLSLSSNQTGDIVKVLTLITVLTTPVMVVATWYGMNFKDMPELNWKHGYLIATAVTAASTLAIYVYFKKKKWL